MKLNKEIWKFNKIVKFLTSNEKDFENKISTFFSELKEIFGKSGINLKKIGDFSYNSYRQTNKTFNLDLCAIKYFSHSRLDFEKFKTDILDIAKKYREVPEIHSDKNYINFIFNYKNTKINFRTTPVFVEKRGDEYVSKISVNNLVYEDLMITLTNDFKKANKLSSGLLISLKRLINYVMNGEFNYTHDIDVLILRWFYEYVSKSLDNYIYKKYTIKEIELNIENFMKTENFRKWIKNNISFFDLSSFIFLKLDSTNTYYFNKFNFKFEEMFEGISRYSLNTNSSFKIPEDYLSDVKLFDTDSYESKVYIQNNLSNENGLSDISWTKYKNDKLRYIVSPVIKTGFANVIMFQKWLTVKSNALYMELSSDFKNEIRTTRQREAMSELNEIANNWLTKYNSKLKYLQPYFDRKYPFISNYEIEDLVSMIIQTINKIENQQWIIKNDN